MKNIIFVIAIFFWILNLISKSKRKQQAAAQKQTIKKLNERVEKRVVKEAAPEEVFALFRDRPNQAPEAIATDYESAYQSNDYSPTVKSTEAFQRRRVGKAIPESEKNVGLDKSYTLGSETAEEKEAYNKDEKIFASLLLTNKTIKQYIVASEIFGKPKALRVKGYH